MLSIPNLLLYLSIYHVLFLHVLAIPKNIYIHSSLDLDLLLPLFLFLFPSSHIWGLKFSSYNIELEVRSPYGGHPRWRGLTSPPTITTQLVMNLIIIYTPIIIMAPIFFQPVIIHPLLIIVFIHLHCIITLNRVIGHSHQLPT